MTHGSHWECIVENVEDFFENEFGELFRNSEIIDKREEYGYNIGTQQVQENTIHSLLSNGDQDSPFLFLTYLVNKELWTAYPVVNMGTTHEITIIEVKDEGNLVEGQIHCRLKEYPDFTFSFFDTMYCINKSKYKTGESYPFLFNGLMYSGGKNQFADTKIPHKELEEDIWIGKDTVACLPAEKGDVDDYKIMSPILNVETFETNHGKFYKMGILLLQDEIYFNIPVLISQRNLKDDFIPKEGESINGSVWLCGMLNQEE